jgi:hypothetical protein
LRMIDAEVSANRHLCETTASRCATSVTAICSTHLSAPVMFHAMTIRPVGSQLEHARVVRATHAHQCSDAVGPVH